MNGNIRRVVMFMLLGALVFVAQRSVSAQAAQNPAGQPPVSPNKDAKPVGNGSSLDIPAVPSPIDAEEEAALKSFISVPASDSEKKITAGEEFEKKYPQSRYLSTVYAALTVTYLQAGKADKAFETGDKEVQLKPDDVQTLAVLSLTIPRAVTSKTQEPDKQLAKAEGYAKRALEVTPTLSKPDGMTDQNFVIAKNATLSMAHGGLGLVYFRRSKFMEAIPELEQSIKIDPNPMPDPINLYALGVSDQKTSHFDDALAAFSKCASIAGNLQSPCKNLADEAKKQGSTQLSAPK